MGGEVGGSRVSLIFQGMLLWSGRVGGERGVIFVGRGQSLFPPSSSLSLSNKSVTRKLVMIQIFCWFPQGGLALNDVWAKRIYLQKLLKKVAKEKFTTSERAFHCAWTTY